MDCEASKLKFLEHMLFDEASQPTDLPISLLKTVTKDFSSDLEIGRGGFAIVYKGFLGNGSTVAVKKLFDSIDMDETRYNQEGKFIMADVRHRSLCFEYLSNGSLHDYISDASHGLEWSERYKILKGICEGLCHLHKAHIVHLDLKPANILLDHNMVPKISDFGLSRRFGENQTRTITSVLYGSLGYLAPEFYSGVITFKSDIYSLGVILTEILTGQKGYCPPENVLQNWRNRFDVSTADTILKQVRACAQISKECMDFDPQKRPDILSIIKSLEETEGKDQSILSGLSSSFTPQAACDGSVGADTNQRAGIYDLVQKACEGPITPAQHEKIVLDLGKDSKLVYHCGMTRKKLPGLVEHNPLIAVKVLSELINSPYKDVCFDVLLHMEKELELMVVIDRLTTAVVLPPKFIHDYISSCIQWCKDIKHKNMPNRHVRFLCVFLQSLIRNNIINVQQDGQFFDEMQTFCMDFARIREAAGLLRLLKSLEM